MNEYEITSRLLEINKQILKNTFFKGFSPLLVSLPGITALINTLLCINKNYRLQLQIWIILAAILLVCIWVWLIYTTISSEYKITAKQLFLISIQIAPILIAAAGLTTFFFRSELLSEYLLSIWLLFYGLVISSVIPYLTFSLLIPAFSFILAGFLLFYIPYPVGKQYAPQIFGIVFFINHLLIATILKKSIRLQEQ